MRRVETMTGRKRQPALSNSEPPRGQPLQRVGPANRRRQWALLGKPDGRGGFSLKRRYGAQAGRTDQTTCADPDSRRVAIKVGSPQGVCYNSPAESARSENGARCSPVPTRRCFDQKQVGRGAGRVEGRA